MQKITHKGKLIGIKIDKIPKGSLPVTDPNESVQVVTLKHPKGTNLKAHMHRPRVRQTEKLQEVMIVRKGKVRLNLYNEAKQLVKHVFLNQGQVFISLNGGVGVEIIKDTEIIEVKNGPFKEDKILI